MSFVIALPLIESIIGNSMFLIISEYCTSCFHTSNTMCSVRENFSSYRLQKGRTASNSIVHESSAMIAKNDTVSSLLKYIAVLFAKEASQNLTYLSTPRLEINLIPKVYIFSDEIYIHEREQNKIQQQYQIWQLQQKKQKKQKNIIKQKQIERQREQMKKFNSYIIKKYFLEQILNMFITLEIFLLTLALIYLYNFKNKINIINIIIMKIKIH